MREGADRLARTAAGAKHCRVANVLETSSPFPNRPHRRGRALKP